MNNQAFSKIWIIAVLIICIVGGIFAWRYILVPGQITEEDGMVEKSPPSQLTLCSNDNYSTEYAETKSGVKFIWLTEQSKTKLKENIALKGNAALEELSDLNCLEHLDLTDANVSDISSLQNLTNLRELNLWNTRISEISVVRNFPHLKIISLVKTDVSDISPLENTPELELLDLSDTNISNLTSLEKLGNLKYLSLVNLLSVSDISALENLPLEFLSISRTRVSDFSSLQTLTNLKVLFLDSGVYLYDVSILENLKNLEELSLRGSAVSESDCENLRRALPTTKIVCF